jgi:diacylglycerol O-acyltransferase / wax synthase
MRHLAVNPIKGMRLSLRMVRDLAEAAGVDSVSAIAGRPATRSTVAVGGAVDTPVADPSQGARCRCRPAPPTPWNRTITPHRRFAMRSTALATSRRSRTPPAARSTTS